MFIDDLRNAFTHCKCLLFADDLKLYLPIDSTDDCIKFQNDILEFENWCRFSSLNINVSKRSQITFTERKNPVIFNCVVEKNKLKINTRIKDLGITLSDNLNFNEHITLVYNKASRCLIF